MNNRNILSIYVVLISFAVAWAGINECNAAEIKSRCVVHWSSFMTGAEGHGDKIDCGDANILLEKANTAKDKILYWIADVDLDINDKTASIISDDE